MMVHDENISVKRYQPVAGVSDHPTGDFVTHENYKFLKDANTELQRQVAELKKEAEAEELYHGVIIDDRDHYHEMADKLAQGIAEYFNADIGEHSNSNCPWENAEDLIIGHEKYIPLTRKISELQEQMKHAREVLIDYGQHNPQIERVLREARLKLKDAIPPVKPTGEET